MSNTANSHPTLKYNLLDFDDVQLTTLDFFFWTFFLTVYFGFDFVWFKTEPIIRLQTELSQSSFISSSHDLYLDNAVKPQARQTNALQVGPPLKGQTPFSSLRPHHYSWIYFQGS